MVTDCLANVGGSNQNRAKALTLFQGICKLQLCGKFALNEKGAKSWNLDYKDKRGVSIREKKKILVASLAECDTNLAQFFVHPYQSFVNKNAYC